MIVTAFGGQLSDELTDVDVQPLILTGLFHSAGDVRDILTTPLVDGRMVNGLFWCPITSLSFGMDALIRGIRPIGYHLTDLILHLSNNKPRSPHGPIAWTGGPEAGCLG